MRKISVVVMMGVALGLLMPPANATLLDYEGFNYDTNKLAGMTGGAGWGSAWADDDTDTDLSNDGTSLNFSGIPTTGARLLDSGGFDAKRNLGSSFVMNAEGNVMYIGMLLNKGSVASSSSEWMELSLANGSNKRFKMGVGSDDKFYVEVGGGANVAGTKTASADTTYLMVAKITSSTSSQTAQLKIYAPGDVVDASEPGAWDVTDTGFTGYNLYMLDIVGGSNVSNGSMDEIRVADTWADAIPEPAAIGLLGMGAFAALLMRRFRM